MGLLSRLFGGDKDEAGGIEAPSKAPKERESSAQHNDQASLVEHIEQCFYLNARCAGTALVTAISQNRTGRFPGLCDFLMDYVEILAPSFERLMQTRSARGASRLIPGIGPRYGMTEPAREFEQYVYEMGSMVMYEVSGGSGKVTTTKQLELLEKTAKAAISESLSLLKVAKEQKADDIVSIMLDDPSYLLALADYYVLLQANLMHMRHTNSVVFIPDERLDPDNESNRTSLRYYDRLITDSTRMISIPEALTLIFIENENGRTATGRTTLGGMRGTLYRTDDPETQEYLDGVAFCFVKGIDY